jgi:hypothetical protein
MIELYFGAEDPSNLRFITKRETKLSLNAFRVFLDFLSGRATIGS